MKRIHKYQLGPVNTQSIEIQEDAKILSIQVQYGIPCIWALIDDEKPKIKVTIEVYETGEPLPNSISTTRSYIGTFQVQDGDYVGHVFSIGILKKQNI